MELAEINSITARLLEHIKNGTTDLVDQPYTIPSDNYRNPQRFRTEIDAVFKKRPLLLALSAELPEPNTYKAIDIVGVPVLLHRGEDGTVRSFLNMCSHRGTALVEPGTGSRRKFVCTYHGWVFNGSGHLDVLPCAASFGAVDTSRLGLHELPVVEKAGIVWGLLDASGTLEIDEFLGDFAAVLDAYGLCEVAYYQGMEMAGPNWKLAMDGYLENYHLERLHAKTLYPFTYSNLATADFYGPHARLVFAQRGLEKCADIPQDEWQSAEYLAHILYIYPNIQITVAYVGQPGSAAHTMLSRQMFVHQILPLTPSTSRTIQGFYMDKLPETAQEREAADGIMSFNKKVLLDEDLVVVNAIQRTIASVGATEFVFGRNEAVPGRYHAQLDKDVVGS